MTVCSGSKWHLSALSLSHNKPTFLQLAATFLLLKLCIAEKSYEWGNCLSTIIVLACWKVCTGPTTVWNEARKHLFPWREKTASMFLIQCPCHYHRQLCDLWYHSRTLWFMYLNLMPQVQKKKKRMELHQKITTFILLLFPSSQFVIDAYQRIGQEMKLKNGSKDTLLYLLLIK